MESGSGSGSPRARIGSPKGHGSGRPRLPSSLELAVGPRKKSLPRRALCPAALVLGLAGFLVLQEDSRQKLAATAAAAASLAAGTDVAGSAAQPSGGAPPRDGPGSLAAGPAAAAVPAEGPPTAAQVAEMESTPPEAAASEAAEAAETAAAATESVAVPKPAAPQAPLKWEPGAEPVAGKEHLDLLSPKCGGCLRRISSASHRSVLAAGVGGAVAEAFAGFRVFYISYLEEDAAALFEAGQSSLLWKQEYTWPFAHLAVDVVVADPAAFAPLGAGPEWNVIVPFLLRTLRPSGILVLVQGGEGLKPWPTFGAAASLRQLLRQSSQYANVFRRIDGMVDGATPCEECGAIEEKEPACHPFIKHPFTPLDDWNFQTKVLKGKSVAVGRMREINEKHMLGTRPDGAMAWADKVRKTQVGWWKSNYISRKPIKTEWPHHFSKLIRSGRLKSVLDAGAGGCTLEGMLQDHNVADKIRPFVAFGAYDCSMLRICGERATISFQWNWHNPLPFCKECRFDLIFQAEGMHHDQPEFWQTTLNNFDAHLSCDGIMYLQDHPCQSVEYHKATSDGKVDSKAHKRCWRNAVRHWAKLKNYKIHGGSNGALTVTKRCKSS